MLSILIKIIEIFTSEIAKKLAGKLSTSKTDICSEILRLYIVLEELLQQATSAYQLFEEFINNFESLNNDSNFKQDLRYEARELLECLKRYEKQLKKVFIKLKLLDDTNLSIRLTEIPESSYTLFKRFFVDDLAPKFIADKSGKSYVLRLTVNRKKHLLVGTNKLGHISLDLEKLFSEGFLVYEINDFSSKSQRLNILQSCSSDLLKLKAVTESLKKLIKDNCDLKELLS